MPPKLGAPAWVFTKARSNFWGPPGFHIVKLILIHQICKLSRTSSGRQANFDEEDMIGIISLAVEVVGYELLLDHLNISPQLPRYTAPPNFTYL